MIQLLLDLLNIESFSGNEENVAKYIADFVSPLGFEVEIDAKGNVYCTRGSGNYILLNAHMDCVGGYSRYKSTQYKTTKKKCCRWCDRFENCYGFKTYRFYNDMQKEEEQYLHEACDLFKPISYYEYENDVEEEAVEKKGDKKVASISIDGKTIVGDGSRPIGGDDKCGIALALHFAREHQEVPLKLFFSVEEETGCNGVSSAVATHLEFFQDVIWGLTLDRRGTGDICYQSCSGQNFRSLNYLAEVLKYWTKAGILINMANGSVADVIYLRQVIPDMLNVSVGYESPHSNNETVNIAAFERIYKAMSSLILKSEINWKVTQKTTRERMVPEPPKQVEFPKKKQEEAKTKSQSSKDGSNENVEYTEDDILQICMEGLDVKTEYQKYYLLEKECLLQKRSPDYIVEMEMSLVNGKYHVTNEFFSTVTNMYIKLPENWKLEYVDYLEFSKVF